MLKELNKILHKLFKEGRYSLKTYQYEDHKMVVFVEDINFTTTTT